MSTRFERIYAVACACCKADGADVPEVEAVIQLLLPLLQDEWGDLIAQLSTEAVRLLTLLADSGEAPELILAAYVAGLDALASDPLAGSAGARVEDAVASLASTAASKNGLLAPDQLGLAQNIGAALVSLLLQEQLQRAIRATLPVARRLLQNPAFQEGSQEALQSARSELATALDAEARLLNLLDSWAYQTFNAATVRAAADNGENFIQIDAVRDNKTTTFCRLADGRVIPMARALEQLRRIDEAVLEGNLRTLQAIAPFHPDPENATQAEVDAIIEAGGLAPFHHGCRSQNRPVRL